MGKFTTFMKRGEYEPGLRSLRGGRCGWYGWVSAGAAVVGALSGPSGGGSSGQASNSSTQQDQMSKDLFDYHTQNYRPLEQAAIADATKAGSPEMQESRAAQAGTTVNTAFDNAQKSLTMRRDSMGIRPDSGATMDEERQNAIARAGGVAGAENTARQDERVYGLNAKTQVAGLGRNLPATALSGEAGAANASGIAAQNALREQQFRDTQTSNIGSAIGGVSSAVRGMNSAPPVGTPTTSATIDTPPDYGAFFRKGGLIRPPSRTHGYKKGGAVRGPGTGTSDSIPVSIDGKPGAIANGEYVLNAKATRKIGLKRLDRMNLAGLPKGSQMKDGVHVEPVKKMADGGVADDVPRITITPKSGGKPLTQEDARQMNRSVAPAEAPKVAPRFTLDQIPNASGAKRPGSIAMKDGGVAGISSQTVAGIKKLDDEDLETADMRKEPMRRADQGVSAPTKQTDAQKDQLRKLLRGRPDADKFKFKKGGAVKNDDGDDEDSEDGDDTETLEKDLQYARGGKVLPMPHRNLAH